MDNIFAKKNIASEKSLGKIFSSTRKRKSISLEKAEQDTKVRLKYIAALDQDNLLKLPPDVYTVGFIRRYCQYLNLNQEKCVKKYQIEKKIALKLKRQSIFGDNKQSIINPGNPNKFQTKLKFVITPQIFSTLFISLIVVSILGYIWFQVKSFAAAPSLELNNAQEQIVVSNNYIEISGNTDPNAKLIINNQIIAIDENGNFKQNIELVKGLNDIEIKAENKVNKQTIKNIKVLAVSGEEGDK